jgi:hypothetical protein
MRRAFWFGAVIFLANADLTAAIGAESPPPASTYVTSGNCLNSPNGFTAKSEPVHSGTAWTTSFHAVGTADANGTVTEIGQFIDGASFGVGPRMHSPAANAYKATFTSTVTANADGTYTIAMGKLSGTLTDGPFAGKTFTASPGLTFKRWPSQNGVAVQATAGAPVTQTVSLADGATFQRICTATTVVTSPLP